MGAFRGFRQKRGLSMTDPYLTIQQAASLAQVEHRTIRRAIHRRQLRALWGSHWLIRPEDFTEWLEHRTERKLAALTQPAPRKTPEQRSPSLQSMGSVARLKAIDSRRAS